MSDEPPAVLPNQVLVDDRDEMPFEPDANEEGGDLASADDWNPVT